MKERYLLVFVRRSGYRQCALEAGKEFPNLDRRF